VPGERWFVARVLDHRENRAQLNLHRLDFRSFVPRLRRTVRHARKLRDTLRPLFPGYIFVIIDVSKQRWRSVNGTFGVALIMVCGAGQAGAPGSG
jgi:transcription antitermination factor NusG